MSLADVDEVPDVTSDVLAIAVGAHPQETLDRLRGHVGDETILGLVIGERPGGYVGAFESDTFRIRLARPLSRFYATYVFGRVEARGADTVIKLRFGHSTAAEAMLWVMRVLGVLLVTAALVSALQQPVFLAFAVFVLVGAGLLLWSFRLRPDDKARLQALVVSSTRASRTSDSGPSDSASPRVRSRDAR